MSYATDQFNNELYHHGVKGMKWGVRRYQDKNGNYTSTGKKRYLADKTAKIQRDIDSYNKTVNALKEQKAKKEAKLSRKWDISTTAQKLEKEASLKNKIVYNTGTRTKAAKYIVDKNMSVAEATKKAKGDAWRNTAIFCTAYGAVTVASIYKQLH